MVIVVVIVAVVVKSASSFLLNTSLIVPTLVLEPRGVSGMRDRHDFIEVSRSFIVFVYVVAFVLKVLRNFVMTPDVKGAR